MKKFRKLALWLIVIAAIWVFFGPLLIRLFGGFKYEESGQLGDMFGGLTAPVIGLLSAVLVYFAFQAQIEANEKITEQINTSHQEANFAYLSNELKQLISHDESLIYIDGHIPFYQKVEYFYKYIIAKIETGKYEKGNYKNIEQMFPDFFDVIESNLQFVKEFKGLGLSKEHMEMLKNKYKRHYDKNIQPHIKVWFEYRLKIMDQRPFEGAADLVVLNTIKKYHPMMMDYFQEILVFHGWMTWE